MFFFFFLYETLIITYDNINNTMQLCSILNMWKFGFGPLLSWCSLNAQEHKLIFDRIFMFIYE